MVTQSSILSWKIPRTEKPGRLQSMGSQRTDFIFLGYKITVDSDCSHEIERCLLLERKAVMNLVSMLKSRDITLPTKVYTVKAVVFPVVTYSGESWTVKKAECQRIDAFKLWCWRRLLLRVSWTARRSNQSILRESMYSKNLLVLWLYLFLWGKKKLTFTCTYF